MSKGTVAAIVGGCVFVALGAGLFFAGETWRKFLDVLQAVLPITLILGGLLALLIGWSEYQAAREFERASTAVSEAPSAASPAPAPQPTQETAAQTPSEPPASQSS